MWTTATSKFLRINDEKDRPQPPQPAVSAQYVHFVNAALERRRVGRHVKALRSGKDQLQFTVGDVKAFIKGTGRLLGHCPSDWQDRVPQR